MKHREAEPRASLPQPPGPPPRRKGIVANLLYYRHFAVDPFRFVGGRFERYGSIYRAINPDGSSLYVLREPEHIREVLATRSDCYEKKHSAFEQLSLVLGEGLLTSDGEQWKRQRRLVQPAFHPNRLRRYAEVMVEETTATVRSWYGGETRDVASELMSLTLRIVARTLFSHRIHSESETIGRAMMQLQRAFSGPAQLLPEWLPLPARRRANRAIADLDGIIYGLIAQRRAATDAGDDLLQALIGAVDHEGDGKGLGERELRDQLLTLFLAGHETTSNALTWTLYLLSQNPDAYRTLTDEVDRVLDGRPVGFEDLDDLPYTEQVVRESMRLYPPVTALARRANKDTQIGPYPVAAGSEVVIWIYFAHRDPALYPDPEVFRPERFRADRQGALPRMAYLPFGGGPRMCIGHAFAIVEARLLLATLVQWFRFALAPDARVVPQPRITLTAKHGMPMLLHRRPL